MPPIAQTHKITVWDPIVRYGHWALLAAFAIAYLTGDDDSGHAGFVHTWSGYAVACIVAVRVMWGFVGPRYARFSDFAAGPSAAFAYIKSMLSGTSRRYIGHSPAAGAMIIALLVCLTGTVVTGLSANGGQGRAVVSITGVSPAYAESDEHERGGRGREGSGTLLGGLHGTLANITLALVFLHILGVALASLVHRENLVAGMITGEKRDES